MTEVGLVIEVDRRDRDRARLDHVRGVEPAAQADLEHRDVDRLAAKRFQRDCGGGLEETRRRRKRCRGVHDLLRDRVEVRRGDRLAIDGEPFFEMHEMR